jgi:hypothetical protein
MAKVKVKVAIERLKRIGSEILATSVDTGDAVKDEEVDVALGTIVAQIDNVLDEIGCIMR